MDFMADELYNGQRIKLLTLVDNFSRESLAIEVDEHIGGERVVEVLVRGFHPSGEAYRQCFHRGFQWAIAPGVPE